MKASLIRSSHLTPILQLTIDHWIDQIPYRQWRYPPAATAGTLWLEKLRGGIAKIVRDVDIGSPITSSWVMRPALMGRDMNISSFASFTVKRKYTHTIIISNMDKCYFDKYYRNTRIASTESPMQYCQCSSTKCQMFPQRLTKWCDGLDLYLIHLIELEFFTIMEKASTPTKALQVESVYSSTWDFTFMNLFSNYVKCVSRGEIGT